MRARARPDLAGRVARPGGPGSSASTAGPRRPAKRLPSLEPAPAPTARPRAPRRAQGRCRRRRRPRTSASPRSRRAGSASTSVAANIIDSDLKWVLIACGLMVGAMFARAASWVAIARAALPGSIVRRRDVTSATMIGVLMSATLAGAPRRAGAGRWSSPGASAGCARPSRS